MSAASTTSAATSPIRRTSSARGDSCASTSLPREPHAITARTTAMPNGESSDPDMVLHRAGPVADLDGAPASGCTPLAPALCTETGSVSLTPGRARARSLRVDEHEFARRSIVSANRPYLLRRGGDALMRNLKSTKIGRAALVLLSLGAACAVLELTCRAPRGARRRGACCVDARWPRLGGQADGADSGGVRDSRRSSRLRSRFRCGSRPVPVAGLPSLRSSSRPMRHCS